MRRLWGAAVAAALLLATPVHLAGRAAVRVSPAVLEGWLEPGTSLGPVTVFNPSDEAVEARVELAWLTHDPQGRPVFLEDERSRHAAEAVVRPSWQTASIPAGGARSLEFVVNPLDPGLRSAYPVAFVQVPVPTGVLRVAVLMLLNRRGPERNGDGPQGGTAGSVRVRSAWVDQEAAGGPVAIVAEVLNEGGIHVRPSLVATVWEAGGAALGEVPLRPALVLPGALRRLEGMWRPALLPAGRYQLRIESADGSPSRGEPRPAPLYDTAFEVVEPYRVAVVRGDLQLSVAAAGPVLPPRVQASVYNRGNTEVTPQLVVELAREGSAAATALATAPRVAPGGVATVELPWPEQAGPGRYQLTVRWVHSGRVVASGTVPVTSAAAVAARAEESERP